MKRKNALLLALLLTLTFLTSCASLGGNDTTPPVETTGSPTDDTIDDTPEPFLPNMTGDITINGETLTLPEYSAFMLRKTEDVSVYTAVSDPPPIDNTSYNVAIVSIEAPEYEKSFVSATVLMCFKQSGAVPDDKSLVGRTFKVYAGSDPDRNREIRNYNFALYIFNCDEELNNTSISHCEIYPIKDGKIIASGAFEPTSSWSVDRDIMYGYSNEYLKVRFYDGMDCDALCELFDGICAKMENVCWSGTDSPRYSVTRIGQNAE